MAALGDEVLDGYMYPACVPYSYPYPYPPAAKSKGAAGAAGAAGGGGWRHRGGGYAPASSSSSSSSAGAAAASFPGCGPLTAAEYFDSYQRAQLMALLSQVSPGLGARPHRAGSRDVAVQVNPRRDASVQCSLGRRTLLRGARDSAPPAGPGLEGAGGGGSASPQPARRGPEQGSPPGGAPRPVRFPRTVAVYSPVASRRLTTFPEGAASAAGGQRPAAPEGERRPAPPRPRGPEEGEGSARKAPQRPRPEEDGGDEDEAQAAVRTSWEPPAAGAGEAARRRAPRSPEQPPPVGRAQDAAGARSAPRSPEQAKERPRFQFLEQKYGYYHCKDCNIRWESAYVWCVQGTNKIMLAWCVSSSLGLK
ncbi:zygote arrest protein 1 isoform X2 [Mirounga angustirostris]|uniref:zygote arrest protein 1 isoform X2 n=1 Tax=Mirounga angustirostris TaxID=9716 RepID=UPI00313B93C2